jgi:hypothetical protein
MLRPDLQSMVDAMLSDSNCRTMLSCPLQLGGLAQGPQQPAASPAAAAAAAAGQRDDVFNAMDRVNSPTTRWSGGKH